MNIKSMIDEIEKGQIFDVAVRVKIGQHDVLALKMLRYLYEIAPDDFSFGDVDRTLNEALWWHFTFSVMIDNRNNNEYPGTP